MLKQLIHGLIGRFERQFGYDAAYLHEIAEASRPAFRTMWAATRMSQHRESLPKDVWYVAKLAAARAEDCGPCTQLVVNMALKAGVAPATVESALAEDMKTLPSDCRLVLRFTQAMIANEPADEMRADIRARWGERGLITIAYAIAGSRIFPQVKRVLGHAHACVRVDVAGRPVTFREAA